MRSLLTPRWALTLVATVAALSYACGGGGGEEQTALDLDSIPTATLPAPLPEPLIVGQSDVPISGATYTVQVGDTLLAIADQFGTTVNAIVEANDISDEASLAIGQVLIIPGLLDDSTVLGATEEPTDTPGPADTPEPTDEPEPTEVEETPTPVDGEIYVVQEGDIPETIAAQFGITAEELMAANGITDPASLQIGQELIIPEPSPDEAQQSGP